MGLTVKPFSRSNIGYMKKIPKWQMLLQYFINKNYFLITIKKIYIKKQP